MTSTHDDSFREIQLSGKQLVFLFMAVVVILVGTFLMGLQVGRGVLAARGAPGSEGSVAAAETEPPPPPSSANPATSTTPATAGEKLSYAERLGSGEPAKEPLKPESAPPAPKTEAPGPVTAPPVAKSAPPVTAASTAAAPTEPGGVGFAIQVAALRERAEADTIVKRLAGKGYPAYVVVPAKGEASMFRVRVGKFTERREADSVAARLQKEEQFKPWIVR
jgi:cell division septation protein DedD